MNSVSENIQQRGNFTATIADYYQLTKPGITFAVLASMLVGFVLGSGGSLNYMLMLHAVIGTYLIAAGTAAHNQFIERRFDGMMNRTKKRPLPDRRISALNGKIFSLSLIITGLIYLLFVVNIAAGLISLATAFIYLMAYTPLKRVSSVNVFVGAVPGALPPVGGWAAAGGSLFDPSIWMIFLIVFFWQVPHVMAIAWMCKDDYGMAGFKMLPKGDKTGNKTSFWIMVCTVSLLPVSYAVYYLELVNEIFLVGSLILASVFIFYGIKFTLQRSKDKAKQLMFYSIAYLPLVWIVVFVDRLLL